MISFDIVVAFLFLLCCDIIAHSVQGFLEGGRKDTGKNAARKTEIFFGGNYGTQMEKADWIL